MLHELMRRYEPKARTGAMTSSERHSPERRLHKRSRIPEMFVDDMLGRWKQVVKKND